MAALSGDEKNRSELLQYVRSCFQTFDELPFGEVDAAVLATMSYLFIHEDDANVFSGEGIPVCDLMRAEHFDAMCSALPSKEDLIQLIFEVCASPRYRNIRIRYYRNELDPDISLQFAGVVYSIGDSLHVVAFRGTDKTFVGWKEDVLLLMKKNVPAQIMAVKYLNIVGKKLEGGIIVTGHSKGGMLASHAAAHCSREVRDRIVQVYNLDGPGFSEYEIKDPDMLAVGDRIRKITPAGSPVGIIMKSEAEPVVIRSSKHGFMQHDTFGWVIDGMKFERVSGKRNRFRVFMDNIDEWAEDAPDHEIREFAELFFELFESSDYRTYDELGIDIVSAAKNIMKNMMDMEPGKRRRMFSIMKDALTGVTDRMDSPGQGAAGVHLHRDREKERMRRAEVIAYLNELETKFFGE